MKTINDRVSKTNWEKLDPEIKERVRAYFGLDKKVRKEIKTKEKKIVVKRKKEIILFPQFAKKEIRHEESKSFVRPKAEYSNRSPYGIATELLNDQF